MLFSMLLIFGSAELGVAPSIRKNPKTRQKRTKQAQPFLASEFLREFVADRCEDKGAFITVDPWEHCMFGEFEHLPRRRLIGRGIRILDEG